MKKRWEKPQLKILVRGNKDELVLVSCKQNWLEGGVDGPDMHFNGSCNAIECGLCSEYNAS